MAGVRQEYFQQIRGAARAVNWTMKTLPDDARQITRVIDVGMSNKNRIERARIEWRILPVAFAQFLETLKHTAVNQHPRSVCLDQVLRSSDCANAAPEFNTRQ